MSDIYSLALLMEVTLLITTDIYSPIPEQKNTSWFYLLKMPTQVPKAGREGLNTMIKSSIHSPTTMLLC